ncbi:hypothetical protein F8388_019781 [Cannabis sativa]|uniref:Zinc knuckle CX2CX4HX4C domain-containing protein n=1 Tax=Cannabis sativa TaxID=3483 RepID=A0A7J6HMM3_CANSA|nr:hypothetical protein F8388_019781 [Cannabis sativa]
MESFNATKSPLKGKCFSCLETSVKLSPSVSCLKALTSCCLYGKVIAPMVVEESSFGKKKVAVVAMMDGSRTSNVFRFGFGSAEDRNWALVNGPWCIRGYTLVLQDWTLVSDGPVVFKFLRVWIQQHNLPHEYFSVTNGNLLGGLVGKVVNVDLEEDKPALWGNFLKVQVDIDFKKPLFAGCFFDLASGVKKWVQVKFEKIGIFCYFCGCLGHQRRGCNLSSPVMVVNNEGTQSPMYGPWLSLSSSYLDVFSGPNSFGSCGLLSETLGKSEVSLPLLPATAAEGVQDLKGNRVSSRRPRRPLMVTSRGAVNLEKPLRMEWHPKKHPAGNVREASNSGNGGDTEFQRLEKAPVHFPCLVVEERDRSKDLNLGVVGVNMLVSGPSTGGSKDGSMVLKDGLFEKENAEVALNCSQRGELGSGPGSGGPALTMNGLVCSSNAKGGPNQFVVNNISDGPQSLICKNPSAHVGKWGSTNLVSDNPSPRGPVQVERQNVGQPGQPFTLLPSTAPEDACVAKILSDEDKALSQFFQAQENLLHDLKHFGKLDLYEIRKIGGDIGVPSSSDVNERTTPFKKRKFEASASLCSRPHKIHRNFPGVIRDFPWDTKKHENESKVVSDEPSENSSTSLSRSH